MPARKASPVSITQIQSAKAHLETAVERLTDALNVMLDHDLTSITIRNHVTLTTGMSRISTIASEVRDRAEDERNSKETGLPTKVETTRSHHAKYDKPKPAKKKAKAPSKRTEST